MDELDADELDQFCFTIAVTPLGQGLFRVEEPTSITAFGPVDLLEKAPTMGTLVVVELHRCYIYPIPSSLQAPEGASTLLAGTAIPPS